MRIGVGKKCLNLIPSENVMSPAVRGLLSSELVHRYTARDHFCMGTRFMDEVEQFGEELAKEVFGAETADLRPLSGHVADMIFVACFSKPRDVLMCVSPDDGGYPGLWHDGLAGLFGLRAVPLPFLKDDINIDVGKAEETIRHVKPKLVIFGASLITFSRPVKELANIANEVGACVGF